MLISLAVSAKMRSGGAASATVTRKYLAPLPSGVQSMHSNRQHPEIFLNIVGFDEEEICVTL